MASLAVAAVQAVEGLRGKNEIPAVAVEEEEGQELLVRLVRSVLPSEVLLPFRKRKNHPRRSRVAAAVAGVEQAEEHSGRPLQLSAA